MKNDNQPNPTNQAELPRHATAHPDPYKWIAFAATALFVLTLPVIVTAAMLAHSTLPQDAPETISTASQKPQTGPRGQAAFKATCVVCHGPDGAGIPHLGKPLRNSAFVQEHSDEQLFELLAQGRPPTDPANTTGVLMPPRGAQNLSDDKLHDLIAYLRQMQDPTQPKASVDAWVIANNSASTPEATADATGDTKPSAATGLRNDLFVASCSACHGEFAQGVEGLGKPLGTSDFVATKTDKELMNFIKTGRPIWDPENTTGIDMPPKGGNPALSDDDLARIIAYIRDLQNE